MSNVILYESTATDFFNQGLGPLTEAKDPKVTEVGNGEFYLELDYPTTGRLFNQLKNGNLIKSDAGHELKDQRFEIKRVVKSMKQGYVSVYAEHISNQALDIALPASVTLSGAAQTALQHAQNSALGSFKPFTMTSDITTTNSTTLSIKEFKNLKQALGGVEGSILDIWGGEYKFDNYHISLFKKRGRQANAMIAYGRNLIDLEQEENIMNTFTSVYPYAVWRDKEGAEHIIEGSVIHSEHADKYPHHKVLPVDFTLEVEDDTKPTPAILNQLATAYIENNDIGIPEVSIKLTHLDLSKTLDYKEYSEVEKLNVFDEVKIYFADFDINTTAKIVRTVWNVNLRRYDEIEVGKVRASLSDRINTIGKQISEARKEAQDARNVSMVAANGVNMVFFGPDEPTATKIGDRWFMEDGQYTISKVWDGVIWRVVSDPRLSDQNAQLIGEQQAALREVKVTADYSYDQLQQTIANSGFTDLDTAFGNVKTLSEQAESNAYNAYNAVENFETSVIGPTGRLTLAEQFIDGFRNTAFDPETGQLSLTEQTINGLQNTVSDPVNGLETRVTTIANGFQVLSNDVDGLEAQLSVTNENVLARVQKGDVISQINLEAESTLIQTGKLLLDTETVVFGGDAFIPGAYIENASIDSAKISRIDANQVDVINLDASNMTTGTINRGNLSSWDLLTGLFQNSGSTTQMRIQDGKIEFYGRNDGLYYGGLELQYFSSVNQSSLTFTNARENEAGLRISQNRIETTQRTLNANLYLTPSGTGTVSAQSESSGGYYGVDASYYRLNNRGEIYETTAGQLNIQAFGSMVLRQGSGTYAMSLDASEVQIQRNLNMSNNNINNVGYMNLIYGSQIYELSGGQLELQAHSTMVLRQGSGSYAVSINASRFRLQRTLDMAGYSITGESDRRLKTDIMPAYIDALSAISRWKFVDFKWKGSRYSEGSYLGLIAQDTPEIQLYNSEDDVYSIDSSRQTMLQGLAIQQVNRKLQLIDNKVEMATNIGHQALSEAEQLKAQIAAMQKRLSKLESEAA